MESRSFDATRCIRPHPRRERVFMPFAPAILVPGLRWIPRRGHNAHEASAARIWTLNPASSRLRRPLRPLDGVVDEADVLDPLESRHTNSHLDAEPNGLPGKLGRNGSAGGLHRIRGHGRIPIG